MCYATLSAPTASPSAVSSKLLVVIDAKVPAYNQLLAGVLPQAIVIILNAERDGVAQITEALQRHSSITHLHIVSHGTPGHLYLGSTTLNLDTIDQYAAQLQSWFSQSSLVVDRSTPQLWLYGCQVADGEQGLEFIQRLHHLTRANIAASDTPTGSVALGGDWQFDVSIGSVEPGLAFDAATIDQYPGILTPASFPLDLSGAGANWIFNNLNEGLQIRDASLTTSTPAGSVKLLGGFDSGLVLLVGGQTFVAPGSADVSGQTLTTGTVSLANLNVTAQYQALQNRPVLRVLYSFQNATNAPIAVPIAVFNDLGSDSSTAVEASSSGDQTVSATDRWVITSDQSPYANPVVTQVVSGAGVPVVSPSNETLISDNFLASYSVIIPANSTRTLLLFSELSPDAATAKQTVNVFDNLSSLKANGLLEGLTDQQIAGLLNWDLVAPTVQLGAINPNPRASAVSGLTLQFSEPVKNVDLSDLQLTLNGVPVSLAGATLSSSDNITWTLGNLSNTVLSGAYQLSLLTSNITDFANNPLAAGDSKTWLMDSLSPTVRMSDISPNPRSNGVDGVTIDFNEPVKDFDLSDLQLTLNGVPVSLAGAALSSSNNTTWTLSNLGGQTAGSGQYALTLLTSNVTDLVGNPLATGDSKTWLTDSLSPTVKMSDISPNPRSNGVDGVTIDFNEPVKDFDLSDLQLTLNGVPVSLAGAALSSSNNTTWTLSNLGGQTAGSGQYALTLLTSNVTDLVGNPLAAGDSKTWLTGETATAPTAPPFRGKQRGVKLSGTKAKDKLKGTAKNDRLFGKSGKDALTGSKGSDVLDGSQGNDRLVGGNGNDVLIGGSGNDRLVGGQSADLFVFNSVTDGVDQIADFNSLEDLIDLRSIFAQPGFSSSSTIAQFTQFVQLAQVGTSTEVRIDSDGNGAGQTFAALATLSNVAVESISSRNFVIA